MSKNFAAGAPSAHLAMWGTASVAAAAGAAGGGLRMTLALMSDTLGLPGDADGAPAPAVRVRVDGSAENPRVAWRGATRDGVALAAEIVAGGALKSVGRALAARRQKREAGRAPAPPPAGALPWESRFQRSGGSRREEEAGPAHTQLKGSLVHTGHRKSGRPGGDSARSLASRRRDGGLIPAVRAS